MRVHLGNFLNFRIGYFMDISKNIAITDSLFNIEKLIIPRNISLEQSPDGRNIDI